MKSRRVSILVTIALLISMIAPAQFGSSDILASETPILWLSAGTLSTSLTGYNQTGIAGDNEVLLRLDAELSGDYDLEYHLKDNQRTTVTFDQSREKLEIYYKIEETTSSAVGAVNVTMREAGFNQLDDGSFEEADDGSFEVYDFGSGTYVTVEEFETYWDEDKEALVFTINRTAGIDFPGSIIRVNNDEVRLRWEFNDDITKNKIYYLVKNYQPGNIMPFNYTQPGDIERSISVLKSFEDFSVDPTHYTLDEFGNNVDLETMTQEQIDDELPGSRPGLRVSFKQPKIFVESDSDGDWYYKNDETDLEGMLGTLVIDGKFTNEYFNVDLNLQNMTGTTDREVTDLGGGDTINDGVTYNYTDNTYTMNIIKPLYDGDTRYNVLNDDDTFIKWDGLESSAIYNVFMTLGGTSTTEFQHFTYQPDGKIAYTYMEYFMKRTSLTENNLDVKPYFTDSEDKADYQILNNKNEMTGINPNDEDTYNKYKWITYSHYNQSSEGSRFYIPVEYIEEDGKSHYQLLVNLFNNNLASQQLKYVSVKNKTFPITTPSIEYIVNLTAVPDPENEGNPLHISYDMAWDAPNEDEFNTIFDDPENRVFYEVRANDTTDSDYKVIKVFEVYKNADGDLIMQTKGPSTINEEAPSQEDYFNITGQIGYNERDGLLRMDDIAIMSESIWLNTLDTNSTDIKDGSPLSYSVIDADDADDYDFLMPGVNYLTIRAITYIDGKYSVSDDSLPLSLSLSALDYEVPIVEYLSYESITSGEATEDSDREYVGVDFIWNPVITSSYEQNMLTPVQERIKSDNGIIYDVYLSESKDNLLGITPDVYDYFDHPFAPAITLNDDGNIILDINSDDLAIQTYSEDLLNNLRDEDKPVRFFSVEAEKDLPNTSSFNVRIEGLDENTNYYFRVVTRLVVTDNTDNYKRYETSDPSTILSTTTTVIPNDPAEGELKPLAVNNLTVTYSDENQISADVNWEIPSEVLFDEGLYGFEIFKVEDVRLIDALKSRELTIESLYGASELTNVKRSAWRLTYENDGEKLLIYDGTEFVEDEASVIDYVNNEITMTDGSNAPNKVYYYYVRTIKIDEGAVQAASSWMFDSMTTSQIKGPINLKAVYDSGYPFDDKYQSIVRFDAPIPDDGNLDTEYIIQIHVKGEEDDDYTYIEYPYEHLGSTNDGTAGYQRMYYRIDGLESGEAYQLKVRIEDRTREGEIVRGDLVYPLSPFSDLITIRTEFDQADYEKEYAHSEYMKHYRTKAEKLLQDDYFILNIDDNDAVIKYREENGNGSLIQKHDDYYHLYVPTLEDEQKTYIYYVPSSFFETANDQTVIISANPGDHEVGIRPYTIGETVTPALKEALAKIQSYDSNMVDYYVKLTISVGPYNNTVNEKEPVSDVLSITAAVNGVTTKEIYVDELMVAAMDQVIDDHENDLVQKLWDELDKGIDDSKLLKVIEDEIDLVKSDFYSDGAQLMASHLMNDYSSIDEGNKNLYIALNSYGEPMDQEAYSKKNGIWQTIDSTYYGNSYLIENPSLTSYILSSRDSNSAALQGYFTDEEIGVINQYKLSEIFTVDELTNEKQQVLKYQVVATLARALNATVGYDNSDYLEDQGIDVIKGDNFDFISNEDALYMYTQVFAKRHLIDLDSTYIQNYGMIEDIEQVSEAYQNTLLKGANLGLYELDFGRLLPEEEVTIDQLIELLTQIEKGLY